MILRFFTPKPAFLDWLVALHKETNLPVVECGCGAGDLLREIRLRGVPAIGLDPRYELFRDDVIPEDLRDAILPFSAEDSPAIRVPAIILVCRPCHTGFPSTVNRRRHPDSLYFYVGLDHNLVLDLNFAPTKLELPDEVGLEGEHVWRVSQLP